MISQPCRPATRTAGRPTTSPRFASKHLACRLGQHFFEYGQVCCCRAGGIPRTEGLSCAIVPPYPTGRAQLLSSRANRLSTRTGNPRRNLAAGAMAAVVVIQLAVAPLPLALAALFVCISTYGRVSPLWLILPVMAGLSVGSAAGAGGATSNAPATARRTIRFL